MLEEDNPTISLDIKPLMLRSPTPYLSTTAELSKYSHNDLCLVVLLFLICLFETGSILFFRAHPEAQIGRICWLVSWMGRSLIIYLSKSFFRVGRTFELTLKMKNISSVFNTGQ